MSVQAYVWPVHDQFVGRSAELARLDAWWSGPDRDPVNLYGRRRVGKSWLFRRFAHGKPAVVLVADRMAPGQQWARLSEALAGPLGLRPRIDDVGDVFRLLLTLGRRQRVLAVVDEFPYLLGTTSAEQQANLSRIQAVLEEERDGSRTKIVLAGSTIAQMEALQAERSPLHGRLVPLPLRPMTFGEAALLLDTLGTLDPVDQVTRFAVAGGMPRYLHALGSGDLLDTLATRVMDRLGPLFNEPRTVLQTELREPAVYFSVLSALARRPQTLTAVGETLRMPTKEVGRYLEVLRSLQLVAPRRPVGAGAASRSTQWFCDDHFVRFWFRFVQPLQAEAEAGADPRRLVELAVPAHLADHTAPVAEHLVASWLRSRSDGLSEVGAWWGPAVHALRAAKQRHTEEVDVVGLRGREVAVVAEVKWTGKPLDAAVLADLREFKLPALAQAGLDVHDARIVLVSRSGFTRSLRAMAAGDDVVRLVPFDEVLRDLRQTA